MAREFMKDADVESAIKTVLATIAMDPRIAGAVLEKLREVPLASSWEDTPQGSRRMCEHHTGWVLANIQHENGSFVGYRLGQPAGRTFTSLEEAKRGMDALLVQEGWVLPP